MSRPGRLDEEPTAHRTARWALRLCIAMWPRSVRERDGATMLATALADLDAVDAGPVGRIARLLAECSSLLRAGVMMWAVRLSTLWRELATGWAGDLRVSLRSLRRSPVFSATVVLTLAIGIGGTASVLGFVHEIFRGPSPYAVPERLVLVWNTLGDDLTRMPVAAPDAALLRERSRTLAGVAFMSGTVDGGIEAGGDADHVRIATVTPDFFDVLGVTPALGGGLVGPAANGGTSPRDAADQIVLSDAIWRTLFASDPAVVGRSVRLDGRSVVVAGVLGGDFRVELPPDAGVAADADVWAVLTTPLSEVRRTDGRRLDQDSDNTGAVVGRVRPGVSLEEAAREVSGIGAVLQEEIPGYALADVRLEARPMRRDATIHAAGLGRSLLTGSALLLLVASLNVAVLVAARAGRRRNEYAIRAAVGAGRARLVRVVATEHAALIAFGVGCAALAATGLMDVLTRLAPASFSGATGASWSGPAFAGAGALTAIVILSVAAGAVLRSGSEPGGGVRRRALGTAGRRGLVLSQLVLSVLLVLGGAVLLKSARALGDVQPGFRAESAITFSTSLRVPGRYPSPASRAAFMQELTEGVRGLPGVVAVGLVGELPLAGGRWTQPYGLPGQSEDEWVDNRADFRVVTSGYFEALGVRLVDGRAFTADEDVNEDRRVVVVDEKLARRVAPGGSAVGARIGLPLDGSAVIAEVVGVVEHVRHDALAFDGREALYVPYRQEASRDVAFVVRTDRRPEVFVPLLRERLRALDPQVPLYDVRTMTEYVDAQIAPTRFAFTLVGAFGVLTLLAAAVGLYGLISSEITRRTADIGLRLAIGASASEVRLSFLRYGLRLGLVGLAAGGLMAAGVVIAFAPWFRGVPVFAPGPWMTTATLVLLVVVGASWAPASRASRLDPVEALRAE